MKVVYIIMIVLGVLLVLGAGIYFYMIKNRGKGAGGNIPTDFA